MNDVCLVGRLTKAVELKATNSGHHVTTFTLAVRRDKDNTDFISCVAWDKTAELLENYTSKGNQVGVKGELRTRNYEDKDGKKVYVTEVLVRSIDLIDQKKEVGVVSEGPAVAFPESRQQTPEQYVPDIDADDLPF